MRTIEGKTRPQFFQIEFRLHIDVLSIVNGFGSASSNLFASFASSQCATFRLLLTLNFDRIGLSVLNNERSREKISPACPIDLQPEVYEVHKCCHE